MSSQNTIGIRYWRQELFCVLIKLKKKEEDFA